LSVTQTQPHMAIATTAGREHITYRADGSATGTNLTFTLCDQRGPKHASTVVVSNTGRARHGPATPDEAAAACAGLQQQSMQSATRPRLGARRPEPRRGGLAPQADSDAVGGRRRNLAKPEQTAPPLEFRGATARPTAGTSLPAVCPNRAADLTRTHRFK